MQRRTHLTISETLPEFVDYAIAEKRLAPKTRRGYMEAIRYFIARVGDHPVQELNLHHFVALKAEMVKRGIGASRIASIINAMKCLLAYARDMLEIPVLDFTKLKTPKVPRREVTYLTPEEFETFVVAIPLQSWKGIPRPSGYCVRALVETLVGTGMRISEALALDRTAIDWQRKDAVIIGKGNKQRTVFFTDRALHWIQRYLPLRDDNNSALFVSREGQRLTIDAAEALFQRARAWSGIKKHVTPHVLRHTTATNLLRNGCPIGFIKEILGHERLETTCRYYLGIMTKLDTRRAHEAYSDLQSLQNSRLYRSGSNPDVVTPSREASPNSIHHDKPLIGGISSFDGSASSTWP